MLQNIEYPLIVLDRRCRIQHFTPAAAELLGFSSEAIGSSFCDAIQCFKDDAFLTDVAAVLEKLAPLEAELQGEKDRWFNRKISPYRNSRGKASRVVVTFADVTRHKHDSQALLDGQKRFAHFMQNLPGLAWIKDLAGRYVFANPSAIEAFGHPADEIIGKSDAELFPPETAAQFQSNDTAALHHASGVRTIEYLEHPDGKLRSSLVSKFPIEDAHGKPAFIGGMAIDITDHLKAVEGQRYAQQQLQLIADSMAVAVARCSRDLRYLWVNRQYCDWVGKPESEIAGRPIVDILGPTVVESIRPYFERALAGESVAYEMNIDYQGNGLRWLKVLYSPTYDFAGKPDGWVAALTDITESKLAEQALRESELRFRTMTDSAPMLVWMSGTDKQCNYFNEVWLKFTGRSLEQELGEGWIDGVHADDLADCLRTYVTAFERREPFEMEYRLRHASGSYRWVLDRGVPRFGPDGVFLGYLGSCVDIDDRKKANEAIRQLAAIVETTDDAVIGQSLEGTITSWNHGAEALFGFAATEMVGQPVNRLTAPARVAEGSAVLARMQQGESISRHETVRLCKDGSERDVSLTISPIRDAGGKVSGGSIIARDISDRKRIERELQRMNSSLELQIDERTELLQMVHDITVVASQTASVEEAMRFALRRICRPAQWQVGHVFLLSEDAGEWTSSDIWQKPPGEDFAGLTKLVGCMRFAIDDPEWIARVGRTYAPLWIEDVATHPLFAECAPDIGIQTAMAFPVFATNEVAAVLELYSVNRLTANDRFLAAMQDIGIHLGRVIERKRLEKQVAEASDAEQRRLSAELHASLGQQLSGIGLLANALLEGLKVDGSRHTARMTDLLGHIEKVKAKSRAITKDLMPVEIDVEGLLAALEELANETERTTGIPCDFQGDENVRLVDSFTATQLFRIAQEAIHNSVKHARAGRITLGISNRDQLKLWVRDDGIGIGADSIRKGGRGIQIMRHRASLIGAILEIDVLQEGGTLVSCLLRRILID